VFLFASGLGHEVQPLSDVRCPNARSAGIKNPEGVARSFHVKSYMVDPSEAVLARYLLAKANVRSADFDEPEPSGPQMPLVAI
jgi:hypothetical protein